MSEHRDVFIHAGRDAIEHKLARNVPDDEVAFWTVSGKPRQTGPGASIVFVEHERVVARGEVVDVEDGRIWFGALTEPDTTVFAAIVPPTRGFQYGPATAEGDVDG